MICKENDEEMITKQHMIGIQGIDEQHKELLVLLDELLGYLGKEKSSYDCVTASLKKIMENLKSHYATEEKLMEMIGFSGLEEHKIRHEKLYRQIADAAETLEKSKNFNITDTIRIIREADLEHIASCDAEYMAHVDNLMELKQKYNITSVRAQILTK